MLRLQRNVEKVIKQSAPSWAAVAAVALEKSDSELYLV